MHLLLICVTDAPWTLCAPPESLSGDSLWQVSQRLTRSVRTGELLVDYAVALAGRPCMS
jgi:hypothetical protein